MPQSKERGIAHLAALLIILGGIIFGVLLIKNPTFFFPKAADQTLTPLEEARKKSYGTHGFIFTGFSKENKIYLFDGAKRSNKKIIRFDFFLSEITPTEGVFNFEKVDENISLASERDLKILGTIHQTSPWMVDLNQEGRYRGPILEDKLPSYREAVKKIVTHYPQVVFWEIWNEPDLSFGGTTSDYARMLSVAYTAIKEANPKAQVLIGGVTTAALDNGWLQKVLQDSVYPGKNSYDVANIHIRGSMSNLANLTKKALDVYEQYGKQDAPLWVTEHGYPADPALQQKKDSQYANGEKSQADFYQKSLPLLLDSGATKVFMTLRDMSAEESNRPCSENPFCSEGLITFPSRENSAGRKDRLSLQTFQNMLAPGQEDEEPKTDSLGTVSASSINCPSGSITGECFNLNVSCPGIAAILANVKFSKASGSPKGTVILQTGGGATEFYESDFQGGGASVIRDVLSSGFSTAQISWPGNKGWLLGPGGPRKLSCRFATASKWIYDNLHQGSTNSPFCATGNSGGAGAIAESMAHYGLASILDAAILSGGPVFSRVDKGCFQESATHLSPCGDRLSVAYSDANLSTLDGTYQNNTCSSKREANRQTLLNDSQLSADGVKTFPTTSVHIVVGDGDKGSGPGQGLEWANNISASSKTLDCAKDSIHAIAKTPGGAEHITRDIVSSCRLQASSSSPSARGSTTASQRATSTPKASASVSSAGCNLTLTAGFDPDTGQCKEFKAPCEVPAHWRKIIGKGCPTIKNSTPTPQPSTTEPGSSGTPTPTPISTPTSIPTSTPVSTQTSQPGLPKAISTPQPTSAFVGERQLAPFEVRPPETAVPFIRAPETPISEPGSIESIFTSIGGFFSIFFELLLSPFQL